MTRTFIPNRRPGESHQSWTRRIHRLNRELAIERKQRSGRWLPAEEYERLTGRPGRPDPVGGAPKPSRGAGAGERRVTSKKATRPTPGVSNAEALKREASGLAVGGALSAGASVVNHLLSDEKVTAGKVAGDAVRAAGKSMAHGAATRALERGIEEGVKKVAGKAVCSGLKTAMRGNVITAVASLVVDQGADTARLAAGNIDGGEYGKRTAENVGGAGGSLGGMAAGAALGSAIFPGVGTVVGGFLGSVLGGVGGSAAAGKMVRGSKKDRP